MSAISKPINRITVIKLKDTPDFVENFNKNIATEEFLTTCERAGKLFGGGNYGNQKYVERC